MSEQRKPVLDWIEREEEDCGVKKLCAWVVFDLAHLDIVESKYDDEPGFTATLNGNDECWFETLDEAKIYCEDLLKEKSEQLIAACNLIPSSNI